MTTYPIPFSIPALADEATLEAAIEYLLEHLSIEMEGGYTPSPFNQRKSRNYPIEIQSSSSPGAQP